VILAGGEGSRLRSLTRLISGDDRPKQFCSIVGGDTLLDVTRKRVELGVPAAKVFYSLTRKHERYYRGAMWGVEDAQQVIQPENKGTAPAILYALLRVARSGPDAVVAFFPSDHYFTDDRRLMQSVDAAFGAAEMNRHSIVLLGMEPDAPETSYGWIEPESSLFGGLPGSVSRVSRFWEKPGHARARTLLRAGCLWNSFVMVGRVSTFVEMFERHTPELYQAFAAASPSFGTLDETRTIDSLYKGIDDINFSSSVLERSRSELLVLRVGDVGWSDWGEPQRVVGTLASLGIEPGWATAPAA
jgi:mannose-1-phosphate guanylyltransferase